MNLQTKSRNWATPYVLDVYDAEKPEGSARVVARCDTRSGDVWRTNPRAETKAPMSAIRAAIEAARS